MIFRSCSFSIPNEFSVIIDPREFLFWNLVFGNELHRPLINMIFPLGLKISQDFHVCLFLLVIFLFTYIFIYSFVYWKFRSKKQAHKRKNIINHMKDEWQFCGNETIDCFILCLRIFWYYLMGMILMLFFFKIPC